MYTRRAVLLTALCALVAPFVSAQEEKPAKKPQSAVASKTATFATVKAGDGSVTQALKASDLAGAKKLVGKEGAFEGTVTALYAPGSNALVILNFDKNYRNALTAVVRAKNFAAFPDLKALKGKRVLVSGKFEDYQGRPEVALTKLDQLKLIAE